MTLLSTKVLTRTRNRDRTKPANDDVASPVDIEAEFDRFAAAMTSLATRQADGRGRSAPSDGKQRGPQPSISAETIYEHTLVLLDAEGRTRWRSVAVRSCFATIGDHLSEELQLRKTVGRLATYLQGYGDLMVRTNGWDPQVLQRFRADAVVQSFHQGGLTVIDSPNTTVDQLRHIATLLPDDWLAASATGTPEQCAAAIRGQFGLGADGVFLHGAAPDELSPIVEAYRGGTPGARKSWVAEDLQFAEAELQS